MRIEPYVPTVGKPDWDIRQESKESRAKLKGRLRIAQVATDEEYQRVISYMYKKFPREMDLTKLPDGSENVPIQWRYTAGKNAVKMRNLVTHVDQSMYAFIVYDPERDWEPVAFAGSYFVVGKPVVNDNENINFYCDADGILAKNGRFQRVGHGIVMFVDPAYRRLGLATDLWWAEAQLYREALSIRFQMEIQNEYSLKSTQQMFSDPSKCIITSEGRLKADGTRAQIRCMLDYTDIDLIEGWNKMHEGLKTIYDEPHWNFMSREKVDDLDGIWKAGKLV
jgi:GNAT superfamily N-acetyltransferase